MVVTVTFRTDDSCVLATLKYSDSFEYDLELLALYMSDFLQ